MITHTTKHTTEQYAACTEKYGIPPGPWVADIRAGCVGVYPECERDWSNGLHPTAHGRTMLFFSGGDVPKRPEEHYPSVSPQLVALTKAYASVPDLLIERDALAKENARMRESLNEWAEFFDERDKEDAQLGDHRISEYRNQFHKSRLAKTRAVLSGTPAPDPRDEEIRKLREALRSLMQSPTQKAMSATRPGLVLAIQFRITWSVQGAFLSRRLSKPAPP